jgi:hypothetical protein
MRRVHPLILALLLAPLACKGNDDHASTGDTDGGTTSTTADNPTTNPWATTSTTGVAWEHDCPDWTTTSYESPPYGPACKYETPSGYQSCSCRYHELCVGGVDLFFPGGAGMWATAGACGAPCETDADCQPAPAGATATPTCTAIGDVKRCLLVCAGGKTCPDGLFCSDPPVEACVAAEYAGGT